MLILVLSAEPNQIWKVPHMKSRSPPCPMMIMRGSTGDHTSRTTAPMPLFFQKVTAGHKLCKMGCVLPNSAANGLEIDMDEPHVIEGTKHDSLQCKICIENFSSSVKNRQPRLLSCAHTFCTECVGRLPLNHQSIL